MQQLSILGATGSIGASTLKIVELYPERFQVFGLSANTNVQSMFSLCQKFKPKMAVMQDEASATALSVLIKDAGGLDIEVLSGQKGLETIASHPCVDRVIAAIVGVAGLLSTFAAIRAGKIIALANKESLVVSGRLFMNAVSEYGATLLPVDSEHNAIFQCLGTDYKTGVRPAMVDKMTLTASGGPFRGKSANELIGVRAQDAIAHPNWSMGPKISTDSATLMNKGFEVIETHWLFQMPLNQIDVVLHPESIIHSFVHFTDGSTLAQLGQPDMRVPISLCMGWPERLVSGVQTLDILKVGKLHFSEPDVATFRCLPLAYEALRMGQAKTCILNAANEVAVAAFLQGQIGFLDIPNILTETLSAIDGNESSLEAILETDRLARDFAMNRCLLC